jgi:predicted MFS family arabinose efflux permease
LIGAVVLVTVFIVAEWRQADPMLDLTLFKRPAMVGVSLTAFCLSASIFALFLYLTLFIQDDLGYAPLAAGVRFLPLTVLAFVVAPIAGKLTVRVHSRFLLGTGLLLVAVGCLLMATSHASSGWTVLLPGFVVAGVGIGTVNPVLASAAISVVPPERSGMASGANSTFRQVGIATGIAGLGSVFQTQIQHRTLSALGSTPAGQAVVAHGGAALQSAILGGAVHQAAASIPSEASRQALVEAYRVGFSATLNHIMVIGAVIAFVGSVAAYLLVRQSDFVPSMGAPPKPAPEPAGQAEPGGVAGAAAR